MSQTVNMTDILAHDQYFARIISMIPEDLYKPPEVDPVVTNSKYYKHRRMPLEPNERKVLSQKKLQKKYDPDYKSDSDDENEEDEVDSNDDGDEVDEDPVDDIDMDTPDKGSKRHKKDNKNSKNDKDRSKSNIDNLRERMKNRINDLKNTRNIKGEPMKRKNEPSSESQLQKGKSTDKNGNGKPAMSQKKSNDDIRDKLIQIDTMTTSSVASDDMNDMEYGIDDGERTGKRKAKDLGMPGSKVKRLKQMAEEVEKKRKRMEELRKQGDEGKKVLEEEKWKDVLASASGERAHVDGLKVKKALKRIEKNKTKSAREWQQRIQEVTSSKEAKQEKREKNIQDRRQGIKNPITSKTNTTTSRDSGSSDISNTGRAGFEGKKTDFLNSNSNASKNKKDKQ